MLHHLGTIYKRTLGSTIGSTICAAIGLFVILSGIIVVPQAQPQKANAQTYQVSNHDSCGRINLSFSENPSCQVPTATHINNYSYTITPSSADGQSHYFVYNTYNFFCPEGDLTMANCVENGVSSYSKLWHTGDGPITLSRTPTDKYGNILGQYCGRYQMDFEIVSVDGNSNCKFMGGNNTTPGSSGACETGQTCTPIPTSTPTLTPSPTPKPTATPTPTNKPTPTMTPSCTPTPTNTPSATPTVTSTPTPTVTPTTTPSPTPINQIVTVIVQSVQVTATPTPTPIQVQVVTTTTTLPGTGSSTDIFFGLLALVPAGLKFRKSATNLIK